MTPVIDCVQGTVEWIQARLGRVTGSRMADVQTILKRKDGESASRKAYRAELVVEILTNRAVEHFVSEPMLWGIEQEIFARTDYELETEQSIDLVGFVVHSRIPRFGASPDGTIGQDGLIEIKCPNTATHLDYIIAGEVPEQYKPQMLAEMACTGRKWCDFVSYDPRLPKKLQLFTRRFERDDAKIAQMELDVTQFLSEVDEMLAKLGMPVQQFSKDEEVVLP